MSNSIRRRRRLRGKRKALRRDALITWDALKRTREQKSYDKLLLPLMRKIMPATIARDLVAVQPMIIPEEVFENAANGTHPVLKYRYAEHDGTKKEISEQRKRERKAKKKGYTSRRERARMAKAERMLNEFKDGFLGGED